MSTDFDAEADGVLNTATQIVSVRTDPTTPLRKNYMLRFSAKLPDGTTVPASALTVFADDGPVGDAAREYSQRVSREFEGPAIVTPIYTVATEGFDPVEVGFDGEDPQLPDE